MAKGRLFMQYLHNKNGTPKEESKIRPKELESFSVRDGEEPLFFWITNSTTAMNTESHSTVKHYQFKVRFLENLN